MTAFISILFLRSMHQIPNWISFVSCNSSTEILKFRKVGFQVSERKQVYTGIYRGLFKDQMYSVQVFRSIQISNNDYYKNVPSGKVSLQIIHLLHFAFVCIQIMINSDLSWFPEYSFWKPGYFIVNISFRQYNIKSNSFILWKLVTRDTCYVYLALWSSKPLNKGKYYFWKFK